MTNFFEKEMPQVDTVCINMRRLLLRAANPWYPEGRLTNKQKASLRMKVTIVDKSGKVVREPTREAMKKFAEDPAKNVSDDEMDKAEKGIFDGDEAQPEKGTEHLSQRDEEEEVPATVCEDYEESKEETKK